MVTAMCAVLVAWAATALADKPAERAAVRQRLRKDGWTREQRGWIPAKAHDDQRARMAGTLRVRTRGETIIIESRVPEVKQGVLGFAVERLYGTRPAAKGEAPSKSQHAFHGAVGLLHYEHLTPPTLSALYKRALDLVDKARPTAPGAIYETATRAAASDIDRWTRALSAQEMKDMMDPNPVGVGMMVGTPKEGGDTVILRVMPRSPAGQAGLRRGDKVLAIDGTAPTDANHLVGMIKARPLGAKVKVKVEREGKQLEFEVTRAPYQKVNLTVGLAQGGIGVLRLESFEEGTTRALDAALPQLEAKNGGPLRGLVLDLRDNPGGRVEEAIGLLQRFEGQETVLAQFKYPSGKRQLYLSHPPAARWAGVPMIVLVNGGSASASELVSGYLQGRRAVIMGAKTVGKGVQQVVVGFADGSGLSFTNAQYFTPTKSPHDVGITPDYLMKEAEEPRPEADEGPDHVLETAVRTLLTAP